MENEITAAVAQILEKHLSKTLGDKAKNLHVQIRVDMTLKSITLREETNS